MPGNWFRPRGGGRKSENAQPPSAADGRIAYVLEDPAEGGATILITAFGCDPESVADLVASTTASVRRDGQVPVLAGSGLPMAFLVDAGLPVELLPARADLHVLSDEEYRLYVTERWRIVLGKWRIRERLDLGLGFEAFLDGASTG